jgi:hypothetical protein
MPGARGQEGGNAGVLRSRWRNVRFRPKADISPATCYGRDMIRGSVTKLLNVAGTIMVVAVLVVWAYSFIVQPLVEGKWLAVMVFVAGCFFWAALREVARRRAESIDYRRD